MMPQRYQKLKTHTKFSLLNIVKSAKFVTFSLFFAVPATFGTAFAMPFFQISYSQYGYDSYQEQNQNRLKVHRQNACLEKTLLSIRRDSCIISWKRFIVRETMNQEGMEKLHRHSRRGMLRKLRTPSAQHTDPPGAKPCHQALPYRHKPCPSFAEFTADGSNRCHARSIEETEYQ